MRTRLRLIWFVGCLALAIGCYSPTAPTVVSQPPTVVVPVVMTPAAPIAQTTCTSATPQGFHVSSGEQVGDRWKNLFRWDRLEATAQTYVVEFRNRTEREPRSFTAEGLFVERYDLPDGAFTARVRLACSQTWSAEVEFTNGCAGFCGANDPPPAPKPPKHCTNGKHGCTR